MVSRDSNRVRSNGPVVAVGGGRIDAGQLRRLGAMFPVVAVDSGADAATAHGIAPQLITGDFDSISSLDDFPADIQVPTPDQNFTDFSKALLLIDAPLVIGLGFLGRRLDHTLATTNTLAGSPLPVVLLDRYDAVFFCHGPLALELQQGDRLSIWPLREQGFEGSEGLQWPLDGLTFTPGGRVGTSNRVAAENGRVDLRPSPGGSGYFVILDASRISEAVAALVPHLEGVIPDRA